MLGLDYYNSSSIGKLKSLRLLTTLKESTLYQLQLNDAGDKIVSAKEFLKGRYGRLRDVCVAPDGTVLLLQVMEIMIRLLRLQQRNSANF